MPSKHAWEDAQAVENLKAIFDSPILLHVKTRILIHGKAPKGAPPCPCCGSTKAAIVEEREDLELLIDRVTGERRLKTEVQDKVGFDALAQTAKPVVIPIRCHKHQLKLILDDKHKIIGAFGGNRSGKTTSGVYWLTRQWMLKGGRGAKFWWVAPSRAQTMIGVEKLVTGEVSDRAQPPAFPLDPRTGRPILVARWPETQRSSDQRIVMIDGSVIELQHASKPTGDNLKGKQARAIMVDEGCAIAHRANWTVLIMRLADSGGQLFCSSTPKGGHWLKEEIVLQRSKHITHASLSIRENPWMDKRDIESSIAVCKDENQVKREVDGQWVTDQGSLWVHWDTKRHEIDDASYNIPKGMQDVTAVAIRAAFPGTNPYVKSLRVQNYNFIGGQDFNRNPMYCVICKIFGDPQKPESWGIYVADEVRLYEAETWKFGNWLRNERVRGGRVSFAGIPLACDATGDYQDPTKVRQSGYDKSSALKTLADLGFDARPCAKHRSGKPRNPDLLHESIPLMHQLMREDRLIINGSKCPDLHKALTEQQIRADGRPEKESHTASDKLSGPIDGVRYLAWMLFGPKSNYTGKIEVT